MVEQPEVAQEEAVVGQRNDGENTFIILLLFLLARYRCISAPHHHKKFTLQFEFQVGNYIFTI